MLVNHRIQEAEKYYKCSRYFDCAFLYSTASFRNFSFQHLSQSGTEFAKTCTKYEGKNCISCSLGCVKIVISHKWKFFSEGSIEGHKLWSVWKFCMFMVRPWQPWFLPEILLAGPESWATPFPKGDKYGFFVGLAGNFMECSLNLSMI